MSTMADTQDIDPVIEISGDELYGRDGKRYRADPDLVAAANAALYLEMPLLLTGEPGCGKTHFAWALAWGLHKQRQPSAAYDLETAPQPLLCHVRSDSRARDLLYQYDAVRRFGDAQHGGNLGKDRAADARQYIELGGLGRALMDTTRQVVLIDEIDKAPRDLPNDLLHELDVGDFEIPEIPASLPEDVARALPDVVLSHGVALRRKMERPTLLNVKPKQYHKKPLVVITSNVERQLPDAFLRRCVFFHIEFPSRERLLHILFDHLRDNVHRLNRPGGELQTESRRFLEKQQQNPEGKRPAGTGVSEFTQAFLDAVVTVFLRLRGQSLTKKPATAELIAWSKALLGGSSAERHAQAVIGAARALLEGKQDASQVLGAVPQAGCLIKLREDWEKLRPKQATS